MSVKSTNQLKFYCPLDISKAEDAEGNEVMRLAGIASTIDEDADGEFLDPSGFELNEFLKVGLVNWHHQASDRPKTIIGEPHKAEIRKDGFYVEVDLYPSSQMARDVYDLAETLRKDSKTRKLGFSIEGNVIERGSDNKNHPDYKIVKKANITGLAVTHMPKNPKTFAEVIKACKSGDLEKMIDEDEIEEKSLSTESGSALMPESVDGSKKKKHLKENIDLEKSQYKVKKLAYEEQYDLIFDTFPNITIEKAEKFYNFLNKIQKVMSKKSNTITDEQLSKAMSHLGFDDLRKNPFFEKVQKGKDEDMSGEEAAAKVQEKTLSNDADDIAQSEKDLKPAGEMKKGKKEAETEDTLQKGSDVEENGEETINKGAVLIIKKAIEKQSAENFENTKALATLVKAGLERNAILSSENAKLRKGLEDLGEKLEKANQKIEQFSNAPRVRRSLTKAVPREKESFQKAKEEAAPNENVLSKSKNYKQVLDLLDNAAFAKGGYDEHFGKAVTTFEASKLLTNDVASRIKNEFGITIVE